VSNWDVSDALHLGEWMSDDLTARVSEDGTAKICVTFEVIVPEHLLITLLYRPNNNMSSVQQIVLFELYSDAMNDIKAEFETSLLAGSESSVISQVILQMSKNGIINNIDVKNSSCLQTGKKKYCDNSITN